MSNEEAEDEKRLYRCSKKYDEIVKQFDEIIELMNSRTSRPPKRRKLSSSGGASSNADASALSIQADNNEVFVQTISKFLDTLQPNTDASSSKNTRTPR